MPESSHYPQVAQVADDLIHSSLKTLREEVVRGFDRQERYNEKQDSKFDKFVTRVEFQAEMARIDAEKEAQAREIEATKVSVKRGNSELREELAQGFLGLKEEEDKRSTKRRWLIGIGLTLFTIFNGLFFNIFDRFVTIQ